MKPSWIVLVLAISVNGAQAGICEDIRDHDLRTVCLAQRGDGSCEAVRDHDTQALCRVSLERGNCLFIHDRDLKVACEANKR